MNPGPIYRRYGASGESRPRSVRFTAQDLSHPIASYGFADRVVNSKWKFLGWKTVLAIHDMRHPNTQLYGPTGLLVDDSWSLRKFAVVLRTPDHVIHIVA